MKLNVTTKFLLPVLGILIFAASVLTYQISSIIRRDAIAQARENIAAFVKIQTLRYASSASDFSLDDPQRTKQMFSQILGDLRLPEVLRIKVWNRDAMVVFSNDETIVGQTFADNDEFHEAMEGETVVEIKEPTKAENISEVGYQQLMEVYVPIQVEGEAQPIGVIETYYKLDRLNESIKNAQLEIIYIVAVIFSLMAVLIWVLLNFLVIRPLDKLESGIKEMGKGGYLQP